MKAYHPPVAFRTNRSAFLMRGLSVPLATLESWSVCSHLRTSMVDKSSWLWHCVHSSGHYIHSIEGEIKNLATQTTSYRVFSWTPICHIQTSELERLSTKFGYAHVPFLIRNVSLLGLRISAKQRNRGRSSQDISNSNTKKSSQCTLYLRRGLRRNVLSKLPVGIVIIPFRKPAMPRSDIKQVAVNE